LASEIEAEGPLHAFVHDLHPVGVELADMREDRALVDRADGGDRDDRFGPESVAAVRGEVEEERVLVLCDAPPGLAVRSVPWLDGVDPQTSDVLVLAPRPVV
jgi:hypothetical protein